MGELVKIPNIRRTNTPINEWVRYATGLSRDEYALCSYAQYRAADPRNKVPGWCTDTKEEIAEFVGISRPGLYKMLDRMESMNLIEISPANGYIRITAYWMDLEENCKLSLQIDDPEKRKQSLQGFVNKVYSDRKQSLQSSVNKVTVIKELDNSIIKIENEIEGETVFEAEPLEGFDVEENPAELKKLTGAGRQKKDKPGPYQNRDVASFLEIPEQVFFTEILNNGVWQDYKDHRREKKVGWYASAKSEALAVKKLSLYSNQSPETARIIINESRSNNWTGFFEIKKNGKQPYNNSIADAGPNTGLFSNGSDPFFAGVS